MIKVRVIKNCVDGLTHEPLRVGDEVEMTEDRFNCCPKGYVEVLNIEHESRTAEDDKVRSRSKRAKK